MSKNGLEENQIPGGLGDAQGRDQDSNLQIQNDNTEQTSTIRGERWSGSVTPRMPKKSTGLPSRKDGQRQSDSIEPQSEKPIQEGRGTMDAGESDLHGSSSKESDTYTGQGGDLAQDQEKGSAVPGSRASLQGSGTPQDQPDSEETGKETLTNESK